MNIDDVTDDGMTGDGLPDDRLRWSLRELRQDTLPTRDLWPQIARRIESGIPISGNTQTSRLHPRRLAPLALAASVLLALGIAWQLHPPQPIATPAAGGLVRIEAQAMTREYSAALREVAASAPQSASSHGLEQPALRELDRSAAQIRTALARDPDARFLLERLRHTYSLRLALTQRAALT